jgi:hypothetical protein
VPPSPINPTPSDAVDFKVDSNNNNSPSPQQQPDEDSQHVEYYQEPQETCASSSSGTESYYTRNRNTTRSWPVIYRNNSLQTSNNYLEPTATKTEQLQARNEHQKRKSTHQYDFDQIFGLNNANYQQYLASHRKSSNFESSIFFDKSPSIYDMQQHTNGGGNQSSSEQTQNGGCCYAPPTVILLLLTLIMTTSATAMLCAAFLTDHWENLYWDRDALINIVNQTESSKIANKLEFLIDDKVARLPLKSGGGEIFFE